VRVVDEQMRDLDEQMTSLDDFVTRARSQNAQHNDQHTTSLQGLSSTVEDSYANIGDHFRTTCSRVEELGSEMDIDIKTTEEALEPLLSDVCQPLADLREDISSTVIQEYQPTGDTPQKRTYEYPTELPRTQTHASLIAKLHGEPSPSKAAVFVDADQTSSGKRSPVSRPVSSDALATSTDRSRNPPTISLRELHPNVNNNSMVSSFDQRASATIHGFSSSVGPGSLMGAEDDRAEDMTMPLLKKSRTTRGRPSKSTLSAEGRENLPPLATIVPGGGKEIFSQSITRRKSPRLN
jgi:kinesin family member 11